MEEIKTNLEKSLEEKIMQETEKELKHIKPLTDETREETKEEKKEHPFEKYPNLHHISEYQKTVTKEQLIANAKKACKASQEAKKRKKTFQELAQAILERSATDNVLAQSLGGDIDLLLDENGNIDKSMGSVILARMGIEAGSGNVKAAEYIRDSAGYKPRTDIQLESITDADRALMEKVQKRLEQQKD